MGSGRGMSLVELPDGPERVTPATVETGRDGSGFAGSSVGFALAEVLTDFGETAADFAGVPS